MRQRHATRHRQALAQDVIDAIDSADESISVDIVEVEPGDWKDEVYRPEIAPRLARLYKKPGYKM